MSKLFGADKKRAELKEQAIANYKSSYQGDLVSTIAQKKDANKKTAYAVPAYFKFSFRALYCKLQRRSAPSLRERRESYDRQC